MREPDEVEGRHRALLDAVGAVKISRHIDGLGFEVPQLPGLLLQLKSADASPRFDLSANFALSYAAPGPASLDADRLAAVKVVFGQIKAVDAQPLTSSAQDFLDAAGRLGTVRPPHADAAEQARARFNVVFLDLYAALTGQPADPLAAMHAGFWPDHASATQRATWGEASEAYSEHLLSFLPAGVGRVLDVGCGLGFNARLLAARGVRVTALSPVAAHCAVLERAALAGVEVSCSRFEEWAPAEPFDCLLFAESLNPFPLHADFFAHCRSFLRPGGHLLMADELSPERRAQLESAAGFQLVRSADISHNVAPTLQWWAGQQKTFAAAVAALSATLSLHDPAVAGQVREILGGLPEGELKALFSGEATSPGSLGRYMIYLLQAS